jgi:hypothetical protein
MFVPLRLVAQLELTGNLNSYLGARANSRSLHDVFSFVSNPASLHFASNASGAIYSEKTYMLKELSFVSGAFSFPFKDAGYGLSVQHGGRKEFHFTNFAISSSRKLGEAIAIGLQFGFYRLRQAGFGGKTSFNGTVSLQYKVTENFRLTTTVRDLFAGALHDMQTRRYEISTGYQVANYLLLWANISKPSGTSASAIAGIQYIFNEHFYLQGAMSFIQVENSLMAGFGLRRYSLQIYVRHHQLLGITPGLMLSSAFDKKTTGK